MSTSPPNSSPQSSPLINSNSLVPNEEERRLLAAASAGQVEVIQSLLFGIPTRDISALSLDDQKAATTTSTTPQLSSSPTIRIDVMDEVGGIDNNNNISPLLKKKFDHFSASFHGGSHQGRAILLSEILTKQKVRMDELELCVVLLLLLSIPPTSSITSIRMVGEDDS